MKTGKVLANQDELVTLESRKDSFLAREILLSSLQGQAGEVMSILSYWVCRDKRYSEMMAVQLLPCSPT